MYNCYTQYATCLPAGRYAIDKMKSGYKKLFKNKNFSLLWLGQILSQFGDRLGQMALIGLVYARWGKSSFGIASTFFFMILPVFLINPVAGVYIDRWGKKRTMVISDLARGILILLLAIYLTKISELLFIYIIVFFAYCAGRFFIPAKMAIIPMIVEKEDIVSANSLVSITSMIASALGFGIGGFIVEWWGARGGFFVDALTFFLSSFLIYNIAVKVIGSFHVKDLLDIGKDVVETEKSLVKEFKEGMRYFLSHQSNLFSVKVMCVLFSILGSLVVFIPFIQEMFGTAVKHVGVCAVWLSLGLFLGSLVYGKVAKKFKLESTIFLMLFITNIFLFGFVLFMRYNPSVPALAISASILGAVAAPIVIACNSLIHQKNEDDYLGRIFSGLEVIMHFSFVAFMFVTAVLAEIFSPFVVIAVVSLTVAISIVFLYFKRDDSRKRE